APEAGAVPRQLPAEVAGFTGRDAPLAALDGLLAEPGPTVPIAVVSGAAGVGKTALALRWAHRVAGRFPDGQLFLDLHGYDPRQPVEAEEALAVLLRGLGVAGSALPRGLDERAAAFRSRLAGRRVLVVLDNAHAARQVRPLLPGSPTCAAVVTSRDDLAGLVARDGARRLALDVLDDTQAVTLLRTLIGDRVAAHPAAALALARRPPRARGARGRRARRGAPGPDHRRPGGRPEPGAAAVGPARRRRCPGYRGAGGVLVVPPAPARRHRRHVRDARPAPRAGIRR